MVQTKKSKDLKDIVLSDDSNLILPEVSFPSAYTTQPVKLGVKSTEQKLANAHDLLEYQRRVTRKDSILTNEEIRTLVSDANDRRRALELSIAEQKQAFQQKKSAELAARQAAERAELRANRIKHENDTQRAMRIAAEEDLKNQRAKELQAIQNKNKKEREDVIVFFEQSLNSFTSKYGKATKKIAGDTGIDRLISSRPFTKNNNRFAHRCVPCGYHSHESLSISNIYQHIYEDKDRHMQIALSEIAKNYNALIADTRRKHAQDDNPDLKQIRLSKELEGLKKLRGAKYP